MLLIYHANSGTHDRGIVTGSHAASGTLIVPNVIRKGLRPMGTRGVAALCMLAFAQPLCAAPADDLKTLVEKGDARGAYELGRKHPAELGNPVFDFYFGVAAIDSGHAGEGVLALERYVANYPDNIQARLE